MVPDELARLAAAALRGGADDMQAVIDDLPAPVYVTDAQGWLTFFNRACIDFAGRTPATGKDRWCVTWRLYTEGGAYLPHEECPMAVAIRQKKPISDVTAVAERPDGSRITFQPHPAPVLDDDGTLIGAVNVLVDVTGRRQASALKAQALRCRRLAQSVGDRKTINTLMLMADDYEEKARELKA